MIFAQTRCHFAGCCGAGARAGLAQEKRPITSQFYRLRAPSEIVDDGPSRRTQSGLVKIIPPDTAGSSFPIPPHT